MCRKDLSRATRRRKTAFNLYDDQKSIQDSLYTDHIDYLMFFKDSVRGLQPGAPLEFRGIRLGTVSKVPFFASKMRRYLTTITVFLCWCALNRSV